MAQVAANEARGSSQPTLRNTPEPGTPEADRVAAMDAAAAAWDRHSTAVLGAADPEAAVDGLGSSDRRRDACLDWAGCRPAAEPEPVPELEAG